MNATSLLPNQLPGRYLLRASASIILTVNALFVTAAAAAESDREPPYYPDAVHVFNGCHLSTLAYLARFTAEFPAEQGQPLVSMMDNADGSTKPHTVALISWRGWWWCRDEYFGVCPLGLRVSANYTSARILARAGPVLRKHFRARMSDPEALHPPIVPASLLTDLAAREVALAAQKIPLPNTIYWVNDGRHEVPLLFFRPARNTIAVYHPTFGTCAAECTASDDVGIVKSVAALFGYRVDSVRAEQTDLRATVVAASALPASSLPQ
jgi:hypothetical protein